MFYATDVDIDRRDAPLYRAIDAALRRRSRANGG
jgi:hypothetical protein